MGNKSLQELSRQYAHGELNKAEYRQRRTKIINDITGNLTPTESTSQQPTSSRSKGTADPQLKKGTADPQLKYVVIAVLLLAAILAFYISGSGSENKTTSEINPGFAIEKTLTRSTQNHMTSPS